MANHKAIKKLAFPLQITKTSVSNDSSLLNSQYKSLVNSIFRKNENYDIRRKTLIPCMSFNKI